MNLVEFKNKVVEMLPPEVQERSRTLFDNYGDHLYVGVANVLLQSRDRDKLNEVLSILEKHFDEHLAFQHPEIRGVVEHVIHGNPTTALFTHIYKDVLKVQESLSE